MSRGESKPFPWRPIAANHGAPQRGEPVRIVAIGSSSTTGLWMLSPSATYPEVMRRELARLRPAARIEIINSGRVGETVTGSIGRFGRDVLALKPDLVIWQLGTNDVAWGGRAEGLKEQVIEGVRALKAGGADVVLMDLQYAPVVLALRIMGPCKPSSPRWRGRSGSACFRALP